MRPEPMLSGHWLCSVSSSMPVQDVKGVKILSEEDDTVCKAGGA